MRVLASSLLIGVATAALSPQQFVLQESKKFTDGWSKPLQELKSSFEALSAEAKTTWEEVAMMFPEAMDKASFFSSPKKHTRRPNSQWDHVIKGADVQDVWVTNAKGEKEREVGGRLENYQLRTKAVDPSILGVDPGVKQFSGYLDDDEADKHLFYCE